MDTDARRLDHKTLTEVRKRAVISIQGGESPASVAAVFGVNERTVYSWLAAYRSVTGNPLAFFPSRMR